MSSEYKKTFVDWNYGVARVSRTLHGHWYARIMAIGKLKLAPTQVSVMEEAEVN